MKVKEFIDKINNGKKPFYSLDEVLDEWFDEICEQKIDTIDLYEHDDFSTAVDIYKLDDGFVGVLGLYNVFGESESPSVIGFECEASEYKEVQTVTYQPIEK